VTGSFLEGWLGGAVLTSTPIFYAALGETIVEKAGLINLGVEGTMLVGASVSFAVASSTGSVLAGLLAGMVAGGLFNVLLGPLVIGRGANQLASGLALMFLGMGLSAFYGKPFVGTSLDGLPSFPIPWLSNLPFLGSILFKQDLLVYLMIPAAAGVWYLLSRTSWGLHLRAVGEDRLVAYAAGSRTGLLRHQALFLGGVLAGVAGAHLSLAIAHTWTEGLTAGRGFIAVSLVIFAAWSPLRILPGALLFGGTLALQIQLQARGAQVSPFLLDMLPYLVTLVVLVLLRNSSRGRMPEGLKEVFESSREGK
jgi:general nucleoside transport system permease protein